MIYLAMECSGEYDDYREVPIAASHDETRIQLFILDKETENVRLRALYEKYSTFRTNWHRDNPSPATIHVHPKRKENELANQKIHEENIVIYRAWVDRFTTDSQTFFNEQGIVAADQEKVLYRSDNNYNIAEVEEI